MNFISYDKFFLKVAFNCILLISCISEINSQMYLCSDAKIDFISNAPLEIISAQSEEMQGLLDVSNKRFAFKIHIKTFQGFNSRLQQNHFYENYMESDEFPISTFSGKIIEDLQEGKNMSRAKGILEVHGIKQEVIIPVTINLTEEEITFTSNFQIKLADHEIKIPKLVNQKIAELIEVNAEGKLNRRE